MSKVTLRPYQVELVESVIQSTMNNMRNILVISPTGSGKTVTMVKICELLSEMYGDNEIILILSHLSLLTDQTSEKFKKFSKLPVGILQAEKMPGRDSKVVISTMQSSRDFNKIASLGQFLGKTVKAIIVDESHRRFSSSYGEIFGYFPDVPIIDFTATPFRNKALATGFYDDVAFQITMQELIDLKYLVPPVLKQIEFETDTSEKRCAIVLRTYMEYELGRKSIAFMKSKQECKMLCDAFSNEGINARVVTSDTNSIQRDKIFDEYENGDVDVLLSVDVLTAGFDSPKCSSAFMFKTDSPTTYMQRIGRTLRPEDSLSVKPEHTKQSGNVYLFGTAPEIQSGEFEKLHNTALKPKKRSDCETIQEVKDYLDDNDLKDSPEYYHIKEAVRVQKIAKKLNMPLIASMLESKSLDPQFLGRLSDSMNTVKLASDNLSTPDQRKALILALKGNTEINIADYTKVTENDAKTLIKLTTGKDYSPYAKNNPHIISEGKHAGKHVKDIPWAYKSIILKKAPKSAIAQTIRAFHTSLSQPK